MINHDIFIYEFEQNFFHGDVIPKTFGDAFIEEANGIDNVLCEGKRLEKLYQDYYVFLNPNDLTIPLKKRTEEIEKFLDLTHRIAAKGISQEIVTFDKLKLIEQNFVFNSINYAFSEANKKRKDQIKNPFKKENILDFVTNLDASHGSLSDEDMVWINNYQKNIHILMVVIKHLTPELSLDERFKKAKELIDSNNISTHLEINETLKRVHFFSSFEETIDAAQKLGVKTYHVIHHSAHQTNHAHASNAISNTENKNVIFQKPLFTSLKRSQEKIDRESCTSITKNRVVIPGMEPRFAISYNLTESKPSKSLFFSELSRLSADKPTKEIKTKSKQSLQPQSLFSSEMLDIEENSINNNNSSFYSGNGINNKPNNQTDLISELPNSRKRKPEKESQIQNTPSKKQKLSLEKKTNGAGNPLLTLTLHPQPQPNTITNTPRKGPARILNFDC